MHRRPNPAGQRLQPLPAADLAFGGVWDTCKKDGELVQCAAMVTTDANELMAPIHDRMPVILPREHFDAWLAPDAAEGELLDMLVPYPADLMAAARVPPLVNSVKNDGPECVEPAA